MEEEVKGGMAEEGGEGKGGREGEAGDDVEWEDEVARQVLFFHQQQMETQAKEDAGFAVLQQQQAAAGPTMTG
jgi:hypothetical protein